MIVVCISCGWSGDESELVSLTDDPRDLDFSFCPDCNGDYFEEIEEETE